MFLKLISEALRDLKKRLDAMVDAMGCNCEVWSVSKFLASKEVNRASWYISLKVCCCVDASFSNLRGTGSRISIKLSFVAYLAVIELCYSSSMRDLYD